MALFKQKKVLSDLPAPPSPDFQMSKPNFDDFPSYTPSIGNFDDMKSQRKFPQPTMPKKVTFNEEPKKSSSPVSIKMDKYEEALNNINSIKSKVYEIERLIDGLKNMKRDEDKALDEWTESLAQIKEKLLVIDQNLFES